MTSRSLLAVDTTLNPFWSFSFSNLLDVSRIVFLFGVVFWDYSLEMEFLAAEFFKFYAHFLPQIPRVTRATRSVLFLSECTRAVGAVTMESPVLSSLRPMEKGGSVC